MKKIVYHKGDHTHVLTFNTQEICKFQEALFSMVLNHDVDFDGEDIRKICHLLIDDIVDEQITVLTRMIELRDMGKDESGCSKC